MAASSSSEPSGNQAGTWSDAAFEATASREPQCPPLTRRGFIGRLGALSVSPFVFPSLNHGDTMKAETLAVQKEGAVLFAEIKAPPMNLLGPELVRDLVSLIQQAEADHANRVIVFKSADPDYFISHVDVTKIKEYRQEAAKLVGEPSIGLLFRRLSASPLVTIAQIEGRARGAGSEFVLACDMRFAARESAIFGQPEPGLGAIPGAGGVQHLARLMGRGR